MYLKHVDPSGLSLEVNKVLAGHVGDLYETYSSLPKGLALGTKVVSDTEHAILVRCGSTALTAGNLVCTNDNDIHINTANDADLVASAGDNVIYLAGTGITANGKRNHLLQFPRHRQRYRVTANDASATVSGTSNVVRCELDKPLERAIGANIGGAEFTNTRLQGIRTTQEDSITRILGVCPNNVPANHYFWAIYKGHILGVAQAGISRGDYVGKSTIASNDGRFDKITIAAAADDLDRQILGIARDTVSAGATLLVDLDIRGVDAP